MSIAADTRAAVRNRPFLRDALAAGVLNYAAAARRLDVSEDSDAVAAALRRFEAELADRPPAPRAAAVRMERGLTRTGGEDGEVDPLLRVSGTGFGPDGGDFTGVITTDGADPRVLERVLGLCRTHDVDVEAAGATHTGLVIVVGRPDGPAALKHLETALETAPE